MRLVANHITKKPWAQLAASMLSLDNDSAIDLQNKVIINLVGGMVYAAN